MKVFLLVFVLMLSAVAAMAVGVIVANRRIRGSCGGLGSIDGLESACEVCVKPCRKRRAALRRGRGEDRDPRPAG
jgi:hypothetical protein